MTVHVCMCCAWHGIEAQNGQSVKNTQTLTKHDKHDQSRQSPSIGTQLSPIQHKNVIRTFCQIPNMQRTTQMMKNA